MAKNLETFGLQVTPITGDGNCQFRALSDQLTGRQEDHYVIRELIATELKKNSARYIELYTTTYKKLSENDYYQYSDEMNRDRVWGDVVTLHAAANVFNRKIYLVTEWKGGSKVQRILPKNASEETPGVPLLLTYIDNEHYQSARPKKQ